MESWNGPGISRIEVHDRSAVEMLDTIDSRVCLSPPAVLLAEVKCQIAGRGFGWQLQRPKNRTSIDAIDSGARLWCDRNARPQVARESVEAGGGCHGIPTIS